MAITLAQEKPEVSPVFTLDEIIDRESCIFLDTSCTMLAGDNIFCRNPNCYEKIDLKGLQAGIDCFELFFNAISNPNTFTIPEVRREIKNYLYKIESYRREFDKIHFRFSSTYPPPQRNKFIKLQKLVNGIYEASRENELSFEGDEKYSILLNMVKKLERIIRLKKRKSISPDKIKDTDEKLVTALYYFSMYGGDYFKGSSILTGDYDIVNLVGITSKLLGAESFHNHNDNFRNSLAERPIKVYLKRGNNYVLPVDTGQITPDRTFLIQNITYEQSKEVKKQIRNLWKESEKSLSNSLIKLSEVI